MSVRRGRLDDAEAHLNEALALYEQVVWLWGEWEYVCVYACMCVFAYACVYWCVHECMCVFVYACVYVRVCRVIAG